MDTPANVINWFEIPVADFDRAKQFYETIFQIEMKVMEMGGAKMGFFHFDPASDIIGGAICQGEGYLVSHRGPKIYFNGNPDLSHILSRVNDAGGEVLVSKELITPEVGYMAVFKDSEGNHLYLHSDA